MSASSERATFMRLWQAPDGQDIPKNGQRRALNLLKMECHAKMQSQRRRSRAIPKGVSQDEEATRAKPLFLCPPLRRKRLNVVDYSLKSQSARCTST